MATTIGRLGASCQSSPPASVDAVIRLFSTFSLSTFDVLSNFDMSLSFRDILGSQLASNLGTSWVLNFLAISILKQKLIRVPCNSVIDSKGKRVENRELRKEAGIKVVEEALSKVVASRSARRRVSRWCLFRTGREASLTL